MILGHNTEGSYKLFIQQYQMDSWKEQNENVYMFELPGCKKEDIKIEITKDLIKVNAKNRNGDVFMKQPYVGFNPVAKYENGVLLVRMKESFSIQID